MRTTRVRTLNNTVVSIPNSKFAGEHIENISARQKILYRPTLRLRYDTAPATMRAVLKGIEDLLASHERVIQDNPRVRFRGFATDALEIEIFAYLETTKWSEYLELAEDLNLRIIDIIATAGTSLAVPMQTLQIEQ